MLFRSEAELAVHGATAAGVAVKYLLFDDEGHEIQRRENRLRFVVEVTDWIVGHLGIGVPAPGTAAVGT